MRKLLLLFLFIDTVLAASAQQADTAKYFEGYIDYKTEFTSLIPGVSDNELRDRTGQFLRIYYTKEGDFKWVFSDNAGYIKSYQLTIQKAHTQYAWYDDFPDTLFSFDLSSTNRMPVDTIENIGTDTVLGCKCNVVRFTGAMAYENPDFSVPALMSYYFCPSLRVNPDNYKDHKELRWDEITKKYRSIAIKMVSEFAGAVTGTFTAIKITPGPVNKAEFFIEQSKIIKPTFID